MNYFLKLTYKFFDDFIVFKLFQWKGEMQLSYTFIKRTVQKILNLNIVGIPNIDDTEEVSKNPQLCAEYTPYLYSYLR